MEAKMAKTIVLTVTVLESGVVNFTFVNFQRSGRDHSIVHVVYKS